MSDELEPFYEAWEALRHDRQFGAMGGVSRIPFTAIDAWATRYGIAQGEFELYRCLIGALDDEFVTWLAEEAAKRGDKQS